MQIEMLPPMIASIAAVAGVVYAIRRNGRSSKQQDEALKRDLKNEMNIIMDKLDDPDTGLRAIKRDTQGMREHCFKTSTVLSAQVNVNATEIDRLRKRTEK